MRKRIISTVLSAALGLSILTPLSTQASSTPSSWAVNEVNEARTVGIVTESVQNDYQSSITREQFCEMVVRAYEKISNETAEKGTMSFNDTRNSEILKAANLGIVSGYGDGIFGPNDLITREQIAAMLVRMIDKAVSYANVNVYNNNRFADIDSISDWALPSVNFAYDKGIMQGMDDNKIAPLENTTCEQAILLVYRAVKKYDADEMENNQPNESNMQSGENELLDTFIEEVVGYNSDYLYFLPADYDGDGAMEAFGITGWGLGESTYSNVDIWFIDSNGKCTLAKSDTYGVLKEPITTSNGSFISWCETAGGSGTTSIILGCKDGHLFEPDVSGKYAGFGDKTMSYLFSSTSDFDTLDCDYIGYYSYFMDGGGHMWDPIAFDYNAETREFTQRKTASASVVKEPAIKAGDYKWRVADMSNEVVGSCTVRDVTDSTANITVKHARSNGIEYHIGTVYLQDDGTYTADGDYSGTNPKTGIYEYMPLKFVFTVIDSSTIQMDTYDAETWREDETGVIFTKD